MNSGDFLVWIQLHEPACHVEKHKKLWKNCIHTFFCTSAGHQQRRGPARVPVPQNQGIYVADYVILRQLLIFVVFNFLAVILSLSVWPLLSIPLPVLEWSTFLMKLVFLVLVLIILFYCDTWCWFLASQVDLLAFCFTSRATGIDVVYDS